MSWRRYDLPEERDEIGRFMPWLVAFMVYLSIVAIAGLLALDAMTARWDRGVVGTLTVHVSPAPTAEENAKRLKDAIEVLAGTRGIARAEAVPAEKVAELLEPWLGPSVREADLPLPLLIDVELQQDSKVDLELLGRSLDAVVPGTAVDDHRSWLRRLVSLVRAVETLAAGMLALVALVTVVAVVFATRAGLAVNRDVIEVLHLIGAHDAYIARQFAGRAFKTALKGGVFGLALAAPTLFGVAFFASRIEEGLLPRVELGPVQWGIFAAVPLVAALAALVSARSTVLRTLGRMV
jgi:cell division transport system permease protein